MNIYFLLSSKHTSTSLNFLNFQRAEVYVIGTTHMNYWFYISIKRQKPSHSKNDPQILKTILKPMKYFHENTGTTNFQWD